MDKRDAKKVVQELSTKPFVCGEKFIEIDGGYIITTTDYFSHLKNTARDKAAEMWNKRSSGWIYTKDRQPGAAGTYFVACCAREHMFDAKMDNIYIETANYLTNWETWNVKDSVHILAWMPIPDLTGVI